MSAVPRLRPLTVDDAEAISGVAMAAFAALDASLGQTAAASPPPPMVRYLHPIRTDPGGCWGAELDGRLVGAAQALDRDGIWGLSLLVVHPDAQSRGIGRALLERALAYAGGGRRGAIILSSPDPRALRRYALAGFAMHPSMDAAGPVLRRPEASPRVVRGGPQDIEEVDAIGAAIRGAGHGRDVEALLASGSTLLRVPGEGFAFHHDGRLRLLAARDEAVAADLLRAVLAEATDVEISWLTGHQPWAVPVVLAAGIPLRFGGAVFLRGDTGPLRPYLPSGAYL